MYWGVQCSIYWKVLLILNTSIYFPLLQFGSALTHYKEAHHIRCSRIGNNNFLLVDTHVAMGDAYCKMSMHTQADTCYCHAVQIMRQPFQYVSGGEGADNKPRSDLASLLLTWSNVKVDMGAIEDAIELLSQYLEIQKKENGEQYMEEEMLRRRAMLLLQQGRDQEALTDFKEALRLVGATKGPDNQTAGDILHIMAVLHFHRGDLEIALGFARSALQIRIRKIMSLEAHRTRVANILIVIGNINCEMGRLQEAVQVFNWCLTLRMKELGPNNQKVAIVHVALANTLFRQGNFCGAEQHFLAGNLIFLFFCQKFLE